VYGGRAGEAAAAEVLAAGADDFRIPPLAHPRQPEANGDAAATLDLGDIRNSLQALMWRHVGVERSGESLAEALDLVEGWCRYVLPRQFAAPEGWQLQNMLEVARLMIRSALVRQETRGVHFRADFPESDPHWLRHITWHRRTSSPSFEALTGGV